MAFPDPMQDTYAGSNDPTDNGAQETMPDELGECSDRNTETTHSISLHTTTSLDPDIRRPTLVGQASTSNHSGATPVETLGSNEPLSSLASEGQSTQSTLVPTAHPLASHSTQVKHRIHFRSRKGTVVHEARIEEDYVPKTRYEREDAAAYEIIYEVTTVNEDIEQQIKMYVDHYRANDNPDQHQSIADEVWKNNIHSVDNKALSIHSPILVNALHEVVTYYPGDAIKAKGGALVIRSPFRMLQIYRYDIQKYRDNTEDQTLRTQIDMLLETMRQDDDGRIDKALALYNTKKKVTFDMLWVILYPGRFVYTTTNGFLCGAVIRLLVWHSAETEPEPMAVTVNMWRLCFDGQKLTRQAHEEDIRWFGGERDIADLPIRPRPDQMDDELEKLVRRGEKHYKILKQKSKYMYHSGKLSSHRGLWYDGRIIIDPYLDSQVNKKIQPENEATKLARTLGVYVADDADDRRIGLGSQKKFRWEGYHNIDPLKVDKLDENKYFLLHYSIRGFALKSREWVTVEIDNLKPVYGKSAEKERKLEQRLHMEEKDKRMVSSLVTQFIRGTGERTNLDFADLIEGKGQSLIFLLYGPPGTGKTMTAEWIAEKTRLPLLSLSATELGTIGVDFERKLRQYLNWAETWNAIVLLDEADVYINQRREENSVQQNALVAALLRTLEYYRGILFMTTNIAGRIDSAVLNRVHVGLEYYMDPDKCDSICHSFFVWYKEKNFVFEMNADSKFKEYAKEHKFNGRDIRNALHLIATLAMDRKVTNAEDDERRASNADEVDDAAVKEGPKEVQPEITLDLIKQIVDQIAKFKGKTNYYTGGESRHARAEDFPVDPFGKTCGDSETDKM